MKTYLTILCLICGGAFAGASTNTTAVVQDKPVRLYVASDTLFHDTYLDNKTSDNDGGVDDDQLWHHDDYHWQDGVGGNGSAETAQGSEVWDGDVLLWSATNHIWSVMTWATNGSGIQVDTYYAGSIFTNAIGLPLLTSEHCLVNDPQSPPATFEDFGDGNWVINQSHEEYVRYADTRWRLQTGGRAGRSGLFQLTANATRILDKRAERPFYNVNSQTVPPRNIIVMGRALYADSKLWMVLPDCTDLDVTPFVVGSDFYTMSVTPQKYTPYITANGTPLDPNKIMATNSVGQKVLFQLGFDPALPGGVLVTNQNQWVLPSKYVNARKWFAGDPGSGVGNYYVTTCDPSTTWLDSGGYGIFPPYCTNYLQEDWPLSQPETGAWWISGGDKVASCYPTLTFTNGQKGSLTVRGQLTVSKPEAALDANSVSIGPVALEPTGQTFPATKLTSGDVMFNATVTSPVFSGKANWVQLINRTTSGDGIQFLQNLLLYNTYGLSLDNDSFYNTEGGAPGASPHHTSVPAGANAVVTFGTDLGTNNFGAGDHPELGVTATSFISMTDSFQSYLVFNPDPNNSDNIWVTLGRVDWGWHGYAAFDLGNTRWVLTEGTTNGPSYSTTDGFPVWTKVYNNSR